MMAVTRHDRRYANVIETKSVEDRDRADDQGNDQGNDQGKDQGKDQGNDQPTIGLTIRAMTGLTSRPTS